MPYTYYDVAKKMVKAEELAPDSVSNWIEKDFKMMDQDELLEVVRVASRRFERDHIARTLFPYVAAALLHRIDIRLNELESEKYTAKYGGGDQ